MNIAACDQLRTLCGPDLGFVTCPILQSASLADPDPGLVTRFNLQLLLFVVVVVVLLLVLLLSFANATRPNLECTHVCADSFAPNQGNLSQTCVKFPWTLLSNENKNMHDCTRSNA